MPSSYFSLTFIIFIVIVIVIVIAIVVIRVIISVIISAILIMMITATQSRYFLAPGLDCVTNPPPGETMGKKLPTAS